MQQEWTFTWAAETGTITITRRLTVELTQAPLGWWLTERYGPARRRRWYLRRADAQAAHEAAILAAEEFLRSLTEGA